ncbi:hypothetical protein PCAR4_1130032 [Paraburkholderia caribensis]|nr:hypothetical protein PCAR4_1130032 [Paraburkholderia caribensis]
MATMHRWHWSNCSTVRKSKKLKTLQKLNKPSDSEKKARHEPGFFVFGVRFSYAIRAPASYQDKVIR